MTYYWRQEEEAVLSRYCGSRDREAIYRLLQSLWKRQGWPPRTVGAVEAKVFRMGLAWDRWDDHLSAKRLSETLGITWHRLMGWVRHHDCPISTTETGQHEFSISKVQAWAKEHLDLLGGIEVQALFWLFDDLDLAQAVSALPDPRTRAKKAVLNLDTQQVFPSLKAAAAAYLISKAAISRCANDQQATAGGYRWRYCSIQSE